MKTLDSLLLQSVDSIKKLRIHALDRYLRNISNQAVLESSVFDATAISSGGIAIDPGKAANVLKDTKRTVQFSRGLYYAISKALERFTERPIRILYAGTGPFATLALLAMSKCNPKDVQFDFLDIHQKSLNNLSDILEQTKFQPFCNKLIPADATKCELPNQYHIIVTETMGPALTREPQIQIMENLRRFLMPNGLMLPEKIVLGAEVANFETGKSFKDLSLWTYASQQSPDFNGVINIQIPLNGCDDKVHCLIYTNITVFRSTSLASYDSAITLPIFIPNISVPIGSKLMNISYPPGTQIDQEMLFWGFTPDELAINFSS